MRMIASLQHERRAKMMMMIKMAMMSETLTKNQAERKRKECFSFYCEVLYQYIEFDEGQPVYFETQKLQKEAQKRLVELEALRRDYQWTVNAYEDLCQWSQEEHGLYPLYINMPMRLGELQVDSKRKGQLI